MNFLGLTITKNKLYAIQLLTYSKILRELEYYLGLARYLQSYISFYAQLAKPFQALKKLLLERALVAGQ